MTNQEKVAGASASKLISEKIASWRTGENLVRKQLCSLLLVASRWTMLTLAIQWPSALGSEKPADDFYMTKLYNCMNKGRFVKHASATTNSRGR